MDQAEPTRTPHLRKQGTATQLIVQGQPFLVLGGELHNSSASNIEYMHPIWERLVALNLNTVLATVAWEQIEPTEGSFDFVLVDGLIQAARQHGLRLILLWFGSWKNGVSSYVPAWIKRDYHRFPLSKLQNGQTAAVLSTFAEANWQADARAFAALMQHIRAVDSEAQTVIMVQVENEVGLLGDSRDHSEAASSAFAAPVPAELLDQLGQDKGELHEQLRQRWESTGFKTSGSWEQIFGAGLETDEIFMAWNYARYVDHVAAAGKAAYDLPLYVNAWLNNPGQEGDSFASGGQKPGDWPSGSPLPHTLDIWLAGAPQIDLFAPDIYFGDFEIWCRQYTRRGNPLFIPEMRRGADGARFVFAAIGQHSAIGTSPFGIDSIEHVEDAPIRSSYALLRQLAPLILAHQGQGTIAGFVLDAEHPSITCELGGYELLIGLDRRPGPPIEHGYGMVIATGPDTFVGAGFGFQVTFRLATADPTLVGIEAVDEGEYRNGEWVAGRRLNGDETFSGSMWRFPASSSDLSVFPIPILGPGTGISRCTVYRYE
jgi:beta-galactosidase GanA